MKFRTLALATTSLMALGLATAPAAEAKTGMMGRMTIDFSYYWDDFSFGGESSSDFEDEYTAVVANGAVNIPYDDWYNIQADIFGGYSLDDSSGSGQFGHFGIALHPNYREERGVLGFFASLGRANAVYGSSPGDYSGITFLAGLEGQYFCGQWTGYLQVGYWDADNGSGLLQNAGFIKGEVRYYLRPNVKLTGSLKYINGEVPYYSDSGVDSDAWDWVLRVDYMIGRSMPVAVFLEYGGRDAETNNYLDYDTQLDVNRVNVGFTFYLGGDEKPDFMYQDRMGAGLTTPDFDEIRAPEAYIPG